MSRNLDARRVRHYHDATAHSARSVRANAHRLDWDNKPVPFKIYPDLPVIPLPREFPSLAMDTFPALSGRGVASAGVDLERLAALLFFSGGVTKTKHYPGGADVHFRAAPSTGALYQTEVYVVVGAIDGLAAGVYHFGPGDFALRRLRDGDFRGAAALAAADDGIAARPVTLVLTAIFWRNTWKYQARGYRHLFWDSGSMLANLLASAAALEVDARAMLGFADAELNALLGIDAEHEGAVVIVPLGSAAAAAPPPPVVSRIDLAVVPLSGAEIAYPLLLDAYADSALESESEVLDWRDRAAGLVSRARDGSGERTALPSPRAVAGRALGETIQARGSTREFSLEAIDAEELASALYHATRGFAADVPPGLVELYLNVHAVEGIAPGSYRYDPGAHALELLRAGDFRRESTYLCLEQPLGGMSSATVFFLSDLARTLDVLGNRGYRAVNLEAGTIGGRLYLAAYAQRFGATGLTFYDGDVVRFFSPHASGKDAIFVTALGRSVARPSRGPLRVGRVDRS